MNSERVRQLEEIHTPLKLIPDDYEKATYYQAFWDRNLIGTVYGNGSLGARSHGGPTVVMVEIAPRLTRLKPDAYRRLVEDLNSILTMINVDLRVSRKQDPTQDKRVRYVAEYLDPEDHSRCYAEAWGFTPEKAMGRLPEGYNVLETNTRGYEN